MKATECNEKGASVFVGISGLMSKYSCLRACSLK